MPAIFLVAEIHVYIRQNFSLKQSFFSALVLLVVMAALCSQTACNKKPGISSADSSNVSFSSTPLGYPMTTFINEASGIAGSKTNPGFLWVEEDSGNPPQLYLLDHTGETVKRVYIKGAVNTDWEDMALAAGPDPTKKYLYIGEIGDNDAMHANAAFYRFEEPAAGTDTVRVFDLIRFTYDDGPRDAEAFLVDDNSKDIYIISKRNTRSRIYKLAYPYSTSSMNTAVYVQSLPYNGVVSAAASNDGRGIVIKTYPALYYYARAAGETIPQTLQKEYSSPGYQLEPQGEAVGFATDNSGFYTLSETGNSSSQVLYFYKKK